MKKVKKKKDKSYSWKPEFPVLIFQYAKAGLGNVEISKAIGVEYATFWKWKNERPEVNYALKEGRKKDEKNSQTFEEYIYNRLPEHLQEVWDKLVEQPKSGNPIAKLEALLSDVGRVGRQHLFIQALIRSGFNLTSACKLVNVSKKTFDKWATSDPNFVELLQEMEWHKKNFFESQLFRLVKSGDPGMIKFVNMTYNADRGYGSKKTVVDKNVNINVTGSIQHGHSVVAIEDLDLPLEERKRILQAIRSRQTDRVLEVHTTNKEEE